MYLRTYVQFTRKAARDIARSPEISARYTAVSQCLAMSRCVSLCLAVSRRCLALSRNVVSSPEHSSSQHSQRAKQVVIVIVGYGGCGGSKHNNNSTAGGGSSAATDSQKRAHSCGVVTFLQLFFPLQDPHATSA